MSAEIDLDINTFHPDRPGIRKVLGDLEAEIMELIWARPAGEGVAVRDIFEILYERRKTAYTTVMNTMSRLAKKHLLHYEKKDLAYIYYPNFTQQEFITHFVGRILEDLLVSFSGTTLETLQTLSEQKPAMHIRQLLDEIAQRRAEEEEG